MRVHWPKIREQLLDGSYEPRRVRSKEISKANGGKRQLGIPTVLDRLIQQAVLQNFFDYVDHDFLMGKLAKRISDKRVLGLVRKYLKAGVSRRTPS